MTSPVKAGFRTAAASTEQLVIAGKCLVHSYTIDKILTVGTITLRDAAATGGSNVKLLRVAAMTGGFLDLGGVQFANGLTIQLSDTGDIGLLSYEPQP